MEIRVGTVTDRGLNPKRTINEDRLLALPERGLFVVCDGVGGHNSGEVASQMVVDALAQSVNGTAVGDKEDFVELTLQRVNRDILDMAGRDRSMNGMATTVVLVWLDEKSALIAHVGDSRAYRLSKHKLTQETVDHTVVKDAIRAGQMTEQEAADHPMKHVINRAVGIEPEVEPEFSHVKLTEGDTFLLCSDGITGHVPDNELKELLGSSASPQQICDELKNRCYSRGAEDNLTAVVVRVGDNDSTLQSARRTKKMNATQVFKQSRVTTGFERSGEISASSVARITVPVGGAANEKENQRANTVFMRPESTRGAADVEKPSLTKRIVLAFLFAGVVIAAFYAGMWFDQQMAAKKSAATSGSLDLPVVEAAGDQNYNNGVQSFIRKDWVAAAESFTLAARKNPQKGEYQYWLGRAQFEQRQYKEALASFQKALDSNFKGAGGNAFLYKALCLSSLKQEEDAQRAFRAYAAERTNSQPQ